MRPATGWIPNSTVAPRATRGGFIEVAYHVLRLGHRHAVAGNDDHAAATPSNSIATSSGIVDFTLPA